MGNDVLSQHQLKRSLKPTAYPSPPLLFDCLAMQPIKYICSGDSLPKMSRNPTLIGARYHHVEIATSIFTIASIRIDLVPQTGEILVPAERCGRCNTPT